MEFDFDSDYIIDVYNDGDRTVLGTQLLEVFAVEVSSNMKHEVYGTIEINDGIRNLCYYNRQPDDFHPTNQDGVLFLTGPHRPVSATRYVTFSLDLKDENGDEFIKESYSLCLMDEEGSNTDESIDKLFDKYHFKQVVGRSASATIYYTLSRMAAQVCFRFAFIGDGENGGNDQVDVYGKMVARYGDKYDTSVADDVKQHCSFLVFKKVLEDKVQVKHKEYIPLLRPCVAVPRYTSVVIQLNLEIIHSNGFKEQLKDYNVEFQARGDWEDPKTIKLKYGSMVLDLCSWHSFGARWGFGAAID